MRKNKTQPIIIAAATGLALCLGLGAVAASAAELTNGGFMVRAADGDEFEAFAGMKTKAGNGSNPGSETPGGGGSNPGGGGNETNPGEGENTPGGGGEGSNPGGGEGSNPGGGSGGENEQGLWGSPRFDGCRITPDQVMVSWSYPDLLKDDEPKRVIVESEWLWDREVIDRHSGEAVMDPFKERAGKAWGLIQFREDAEIVGVRSRVVDASDPSRATSWIDVELGSGDTECTIR